MATAIQVESVWNGLTDNSGQPLAAGKVYTYYAGTTTPVSLYTSSDKSTLATNPLILNGYGKAQVWADGRYKFVIKTSADVLISTLDNLLYGFDDSTLLWGGLSAGSASAQTVSVPATITAYANGQRLSFIAGYSSTGATTMTLNSLAAVNITKGPSSVSLQAGDILAGQLINCTYYGGVFRLEEYPTVADVQRSRSRVASNVAGLNTITADLTPALSSYELGMVVLLKAVNTSTSAVTLNLNGLGAKVVQWRNLALVGGEIEANAWVELVYDGTQFQSLNLAGKATARAQAPTLGQVQDSGATWGGTSAGTANAQTLTLTPAITAYAAGQRFRFVSGFLNTGATTLNINGVGAVDLVFASTGGALVGGYLEVGLAYEIIYHGTNFKLLNDPLPIKRGDYDYLGQSTGTANALVLTSGGPKLTTTATQKTFMFATNLANTGAVTVAIDGLTAINILNPDTTALSAGQLQASRFYQLMLINGTSLLVDPSPEWIAFAPVITQVATQTYTNNYSYYQRGLSNLIIWRFSVTITSATGTAGNQVAMTPPVVPLVANPYLADGVANIFDTSANTIYTCTANFVGTTALRFYTGSGTAANHFGATPNLALGVGDVISGIITYRA